MSGINIEVRGINQTIQNVNIKSVQIDNTVIDATYKVMEKIVEHANEIVYQDYETWSHGWSTAPIEEMWRHGPVEFTHGYGCKAILSNESDHAASQEFGVHHRIYPKNSKKLRLGDNTYKDFVEGHKGKYFLTRATNENDNEYFKIWIDYVKKVI